MILLPIAKDWLKVLGGVVGSEYFCSNVFGRNMANIVQDMDHLELVDFLYLWSKLAVLLQHKDLMFLKASVIAWTVKYDEVFESIFWLVLHFPFNSQDP